MQRELFRAKEVETDKWIISDSFKWIGNIFYLLDKSISLDSWRKCDPNTRSVSYQNMIDKNGKRIFASLSEDGVGGDDITFNQIVGSDTHTKTRFVFMKHGCMCIGINTPIMSLCNIEVIGIHKANQ